MRQLIDLLNSLAGSVGRAPGSSFPGSTPAAAAARGIGARNSSASSRRSSSTAAAATTTTTTATTAAAGLLTHQEQEQQLEGLASEAGDGEQGQMGQGMSPAAAARHPALRAAELALAERLRNNAVEVHRDYLQLHQLNEQLLQENSFEAAAMRRELNRYCDVLPYDGNRIRLGKRMPSTRPASGSSDGSEAGGDTEGEEEEGEEEGGKQGSGVPLGADYMNASPLLSGPVEPCGVQWQYIAAQGPLKHTRSSFWQMVTEQQCSAVVMLTNTVERGMNKCWPYFPEPAKTAKSMGRFVVSTASVEQLLPDLHRRTLVIKDTESSGSSSSGGQQQRYTVQHYHYTAWPDHGVPTASEPLLRLCQELRDSGAHDAPILVHCSAGIGRSGVFCVLDIISRRLLHLLGSSDEAAAAAAVDVAGLVAQLRRQRLGMVQTHDQLVFCHTALLHFVRQLAEQQAQQGQGDVGEGEEEQPQQQQTQQPQPQQPSPALAGSLGPAMAAPAGGACT